MHGTRCGRMLGGILVEKLEAILLTQRLSALIAVRWIASCIVPMLIGRNTIE